jgi:hypothetical protein
VLPHQGTTRISSEHLIGPDELVRLYDEEVVGFVVYNAEMTFKEGA